MNATTKYGLLGVGLFLALWQTQAMCFDSIIIASPADTLLSLAAMLRTRVFWINLGVTVERFVLSLLIGALSGFVLGVVAGLNDRVRWVLEPFRWALMTMPPVVLVVVSMICFGMGGAQTVFVTSVLILPIIYANTIEGIRAVDAGIVEMGRVYGAGQWMLFRNIYLPGIGGPVLAGLNLSAGLGIRIVVLAEILGAYSGIGYEFALARTNMDTPSLFAWILVCLMLGGGIETGILGPLRARLSRWERQ
ncbi:ABC transporter permease [Desulfoplanes sp. PS50]